MTEQISPDGQWRWDGSQWVPNTYGAQPAAPPGYGVQPYPGPPPSSTDTLAVVSLVASLVWLGGVGSIVGVITGHLSRGNAKKAQRQPSGLALAGLVIGYLGIAGMVVLVGFAVVFGFAVAHEVKDNPRLDLYLVSSCEQSFHDTHQRYGSAEELRTDGCVFSAFNSEIEVVRYSATDYCLKGTKRGTVRYYSPKTDLTAASCE